MSLLSNKILNEQDLKALIELNTTMDVMEEQLLATLKLLRDTRHNNKLLIEHISSGTNIVCFLFYKQNLLKKD